MYLDQGYEIPRKFIIDIIAPRLGGIMAQQSWIDAKSLFQEKAQDHFGMTPRYETISEDGPDHDKQFEVGVYVDEKCLGKGVGKSKQEGAQAAAQNALVEMGWKESVEVEK
jgi:ribonuclease-3